jgi:hypothetical protein
MRWVFGVDDGGEGTADDVVRSIGALLVGRRTQSVEDRLHPGFYGGAYSGPFFVLRHDPPSKPSSRASPAASSTPASSKRRRAHDRPRTAMSRR